MTQPHVPYDTILYVKWYDHLMQSVFFCSNISTVHINTLSSVEDVGKDFCRCR